MVRSEKAKDAALLTALMIILLSISRLAFVPDWTAVGVARGCPFPTRLVYSFFHASPIHAVLNAWCLLSVVFLFHVSLSGLAAAYAVAVAVPSIVLSEVPTVGLSCVCWFLIGSVFFQARRRLRFLSCALVYIAVGFLFPSVNAAIHLYGFLAGLLFATLKAPVSCLLPKK